MPLPILITRPLPAAERFAALLRGKLGEDTPIILSPVMTIEQLNPVWPAFAQYGAVLVTSAQVLSPLAAAVGEYDLPVFCVGTATTQMARDLGLAAVEAGQTAQELLHYVTDSAPNGRLLYARGAQISLDMATALKTYGLETDEVVVYQQNEQRLNDAAMDLLAEERNVVLPVFSARSADLFFQQCPTDAHLCVVAISQTVADTIPAPFRRNVTVAPNPTAERMAETVRVAAVDA